MAMFEKNHSRGGVDTLSMTMYNLVMGLVVLYGLVMNIIMCRCFFDQSVAIVSKHPILFLIVYFVLAIVGGIIANKSDNPIISFVGYNMIVLPFGVVLSAEVGSTYAPIVMQAVGITAAIVLVMIILSCIFPKFFLSIGKALFMSLIALIVASVLLAIFKISTAWIAYIGAGIFSLYIGYDIQRAQQYTRTVDNAIDCAIDIYLDIINLFLRILSIIGRKND